MIFISRILILLLGIALLASSCGQSHKNDSAENIDTYMASLSAQAVKRASSSYGVVLDYSPDSIKEVEKILGIKYEMQKMHEEDNVWIKFHFLIEPGGVKKYFPPKNHANPTAEKKSAPKS